MADYNCGLYIKMSCPKSKQNTKTKQRRKALQSIWISGLSLAALPASWMKPVVDSIVLPVHAQTTPGVPSSLQSSVSVNGDEATITASADNADTLEISVGGTVVWTNSSYTGTFPEWSYTYTVKACNDAGCTKDEGTFEIKETTNTKPTLDSISVSWDTLISHWWDNYSISKNVNHNITLNANGSDLDGDNIQIEVNGVLYSWTSKTFTLNIPWSVIEPFQIRAFDGKDYSANTILVQIFWA